MGMFSHDEVWRDAIANPNKPVKPHIYMDKGYWRCRMRSGPREFVVGTGRTISDAVEMARRIYLRKP